MDLRHLVFSFLTAAAGGTLLSSGVLRQSRVGRRYYLYHGLILLAFLGLGFAILPPDFSSPGIRSLFWIFFTAALGFSVSAVRFPAPSYLFLFISGASFIALILLDLKQSFPTLPTPFRYPAFAFDLISSALYLGVTLGAMLLGHWYLIQPKLPIDELMRLTKGYVILSGVRAAWSAYVIAVVLAPKSEAEIYRYLFSSTPGLFSTMRWLWGCLAPLGLSYWIWHTTKIRSTQSATGILYVACLCVIIGEILSHYLAFFHGLPV